MNRADLLLVKGGAAAIRKWDRKARRLSIISNLREDSVDYGFDSGREPFSGEFDEPAENFDEDNIIRSHPEQLQDIIEEQQTLHVDEPIDEPRRSDRNKSKIYILSSFMT